MVNYQTRKSRILVPFTCSVYLFRFNSRSARDHVTNDVMNHVPSLHGFSSTSGFRLSYYRSACHAYRQRVFRRTTTTTATTTTTTRKVQRLVLVERRRRRRSCPSSSFNFEGKRTRYRSQLRDREEERSGEPRAKGGAVVPSWHRTRNSGEQMSFRGMPAAASFLRATVFVLPRFFPFWSRRRGGGGGDDDHHVLGTGPSLISCPPMPIFFPPLRSFFLLASFDSAVRQRRSNAVSFDPFSFILIIIIIDSFVLDRHRFSYG